MYKHKIFVPLILALVLAVVGADMLSKMEFGPKNDVQGPVISMITAAAVERAGATIVSTDTPSQP